MKFVVAFIAAVAILCCDADDSVTTSILLPGALFQDGNFPKPTFVGQATVTSSTTYYTLDCYAGGAANYFTAGNRGPSYTFLALSASTRYLVDNYIYPVESDAAATSVDTVLAMTTINCDPLGNSGSATCTTYYEQEDEDASTDLATNETPATNIESGLYTVFFTEAAGYSAAATSASPSPTVPHPTVKPTTTPPAQPSLGPSTKVGIALGVPLGACALAGVAFLLYRHGKHKERSRMNQMGNLATPPAPPPPPSSSAVASGSEGKRFSDAGMEGQTMGRSPPVYSMEMQG